MGEVTGEDAQEADGTEEAATVEEEDELAVGRIGEGDITDDPTRLRYLVNNGMKAMWHNAESRPIRPKRTPIAT